MSALESRVPTIKLWDLLLVPLQGDVGDAEVEALTEDVLRIIKDKEIRGLVIDVTGVWMLDSHLCAALSSLAQAARLMGTQSVLCGLRPEIGMTLTTMGIEFRGVDTESSLEKALSRLGYGRVDDDMDGDERDDEGEALSDLDSMERLARIARGETR